MAVTNTKILRMVFGNEMGASVTISIDSPRDSVTPAEITAAMDTIISKNIFESNGGNLITKKDVKIVDTATNDMYDPAV